MKDKLLIIVIIFILMLAGAAYALFWLTENHRSQSFKNGEPKRISDSLQESSARLPEKDPTENSSKPTSIWEKLPLNALPKSLKNIPQPSDTAVLINLSRLRAVNLSVGDKLSFVIPQNGYLLSVKISEMTEQKNGITILKSEPDQYITNYVTIILGQKTTLGNFFTPAGEYELLGNLEAGWLADTRSFPGPSEGDYIADKEPRMLEKPMSLDRPLPIRE